MGAQTVNPNDGTVLGTAEVISDEYIDPILGCRVINVLPPTPYKMPRSKIAVGPYGQDFGDASADYPLPTESRAERQLLETQSLRQRFVALTQLQRYAQETVPLADARGHDMSTRGVR